MKMTGQQILDAASGVGRDKRPSATPSAGPTPDQGAAPLVGTGDSLGALAPMLAEIEKILAGIDATESDQENGWWETSTGAAFGAKKLADIRALFASPNAPAQPRDQ